MSGCDYAIEYVYQYLDKEASFLKNSRIRLHLRRCAPCMDAFQFEARLKEIIRERGKSEPPPELFDTLRALIQQERENNESEV